MSHPYFDYCVPALLSLSSKNIVLLERALERRMNIIKEKGMAFIWDWLNNLGLFKFETKLLLHLHLGYILEVYKVVNNIKGWLGSICHWFGSLKEVWYKPYKWKHLLMLSIVNTWIFPNDTVFTESLHGFREKMALYLDKKYIRNGLIRRSASSSEFLWHWRFILIWM